MMFLADWLKRKKARAVPRVETPIPQPPPLPSPYSDPLPLFQPDELIDLAEQLHHESNMLSVNMTLLREAFANDQQAGIQRLVEGGERQRERVRAGTVPRAKDGRFMKGDGA